MRNIIFSMVTILACSCKPGVSLPGQSSDSEKSKSANSSLSPGRVKAVPSEGVQTIPDDPEEEIKAMEPAIIGGAFLYCDTSDTKEKAPVQAHVGCRVGGVDQMTWSTAEKSAQMLNFATGDMIMEPIIYTSPGSPYYMSVSTAISQVKSLEMQLSINLPQGPLQMTSTVSPFHPKLAELRLEKGVSFFSTTDGQSTYVDRKSWNQWMPLKIPSSLRNFGVVTGKVDKNAAAHTIELHFDDTICFYKIGSDQVAPKGKNAQVGDYVFDSCEKSMWLAEQWVRSKTVSLKIVSNPASAAAGNVGVVFEPNP